MVTKQGWLVIDFPINVIDTHYDIITVHLYDHEEKANSNIPI